MKSWFQPERFSLVSHRALTAYCLVAALSIGLTQIIILPLIAYWLGYVWHNRASITASLRSTASFDGSDHTRPARLTELSAPLALATPMVSWVLVSLIAAIIGINWHRALPDALKGSLYLLLPFVVLSSFFSAPLSLRMFLGRLEQYLAALIFGQCVAAFHSVLNDGFEITVPIGLPGPVTESGQLVLIIPSVLATAFFYLTVHGKGGSGYPSINGILDEDQPARLRLFSISFSPPGYAAALFSVLLLAAWPQVLPIDSEALLLGIRWSAALLALTLMLVPSWKNICSVVRLIRERRPLGSVELYALIWPAAALLFAALMLNLKRGPWLAVFVELVIIGLVLSRRLLTYGVLFFCGLLVCLAPARARLASFEEHFSISGGRKYMWELGSELAQRFPLGLGPNNAAFMRQLDPTLPELHRHMHNNLLNVAVETGWIGLAVYLWWMWVALSIGFAAWRKTRGSRDRMVRQFGLVALCLSTAILGWQVAGTVEYNFGDGEIRTIAYFYLGLILAISRFTSTETSVTGTPSPELH